MTSQWSNGKRNDTYILAKRRFILLPRLPTNTSLPLSYLCIRRVKYPWVSISYVGQACLHISTQFAEQNDVAVMQKTCNRRIFASNLDRYIGCTGWRFSWFSSIPSGVFRGSTSITSQPLPSRSYLIYSLMILPVFAINSEILTAT
jgi:hypothetical protein